MINTISGIKIQKFSPNLGAIITDVDLSKGVNDDQFKDIEKAFLEYQVLFFQNQNEISPELHLKFGKLFGELHMHPAAPSMNGYPEILKFMHIKIVKLLMVNFGILTYHVILHHLLEQCYNYTFSLKQVETLCFLTCMQLIMS